MIYPCTRMQSRISGMFWLSLNHSDLQFNVMGYISFDRPVLSPKHIDFRSTRIPFYYFREY